VKFVKSFATWQHLAASGGLIVPTPIHLLNLGPVPILAQGPLLLVHARLERQNLYTDELELRHQVNPLECRGDYSATSNKVQAVDGMGGLLHLVQPGGARPGPSSLYQMCSPPINGQCTNHCIDGPLLYAFNVEIKG